MIPLSYSVRSLLVRKRTTLAAALGLALVTFVFASASMLVHGVHSATLRATDPDGAIVLRAGASSELESHFDARALSAIAAAPGVARDQSGHPLLAGELIVLLALDKLGSGVCNVSLRGVPDGFWRTRLGPTFTLLAGRAPRLGYDEVIVGRALWTRFRGLSRDGSVEVASGPPLRVVGEFSAGGSSYESELWTEVSVAQRAFAESGVVSSARVRLTSPSAFDAFKLAVEADRELGANVYRQDELAERQTQGTALFLGAIGTLLALLFGVGAVIGATITLHATIAQRRREIGTLRALGFSRRQILVAFLIESVVLSFAGSALGVLGALCLSTQRISMVNTATWSELAFRFEPSTTMLIGAAVLATLLGMLGGFLPALAATRIDPAAAMRGA